MTLRSKRSKLPDSLRKALEEQHPQLSLSNSTGRYGIGKAEADGISFDSTLEKQQYFAFKRYGVEYQLKPRFCLWRGFVADNGDKIRPIHFTVDFAVTSSGEVWYIDTKGVVTPDYILRWKLFVGSISQHFIHIKTAKEAEELAVLVASNTDLHDYARNRFYPKHSKCTRKTSTDIKGS